jgi:predicted transcriptional regulator of viral defense system
VARYRTLGRLSAIAEEQWGLLTRRQAELAGVSRATIQRLASRGVLGRVAQGVYRLSGAPTPDHEALRTAWLQLASGVPTSSRTPEQGVVSHRSAAALYGLGDLPADRHDFTLPTRRQSRRSDVRFHKRKLAPGEWTTIHGLPATRPSRIAADLLDDREDPEAVAHIVAEAIRAAYDYPGTFADALAPQAARFGLRRGDGVALLRWLLDLAGESETTRWMEEARAHGADLPAHGREDKAAPS